MRGHLRQRGDAWELRVYLGRDAVTGRERYGTKTVRCGKREAQRLLNEMIVEAERGSVARTSATVAELLDAWFEQAQRDFSPKTVRETKGFIERTLKPGIGHVTLPKLTPQLLDRYYASLLVDSGKGHPLAPATIRRVHGILRRALQQGVRWGWLGTNVAASASPPRVPASTIEPPSPADVVRLLRAAEESDPELAALVVVSAATGARRSEVVALRWSDLNLDAKVLVIGRGIVMGPDGLVEKDTKTHSVRRVSLDPVTVGVLQAHRDRCQERSTACGVAWSEEMFVFTSTVDGTAPIFPDSVSRSFRRLCDKLDMPPYRLHDLRHYVATQLLSQGVDVRTVAGRLGHRNAATTLNVYSHFLEAKDEEAALVLAGLIAPRDD